VKIAKLVRKKEWSRAAEKKDLNSIITGGHVIH
jgi:hypothetical protein